jgi:hypothetical protein
MALDGFNISEETVGRGTGFTLSVAVFVTPPKDAEMLTQVEDATALVVTVKDAVMEPAGTVTLEGT